LCEEWGLQIVFIYISFSEQFSALGNFRSIALRFFVLLDLTKGSYESVALQLE